MIDWIRSWFCKHGWDKLHTLAVKEIGANNPYAYVHHWSCKKCLKQRRLTCGE